jgi:HK97 family phage major capsid protein
MDLQTLYAKKEAAYRAMKDIRDSLERDGKFTDATQEAKWNQADADFRDADNAIRNLNKFAEMEREVVARELDAQERSGKTVVADKALEYGEVFNRFLTRGLNNLTAEERKTLEYRGTDPQITATDSKGGFLVPRSFSEELTLRMKYFGPMLEAARIYEDVIGGNLDWPTGDDTSNTGTTQTEGSAIAVQDMAFGRVVFGNHTLTSGIIKISEQLLQDERVSLLTEVLLSALSERIGRRANNLLTLGTGSSQPAGVVPYAVNQGKETASQTAFTKLELIDLQHSVDRAYRANPSSAFMMNDTILAAARKLDVGNTDTVQIFYPGLATGEPDRLLGQRVWINNDMAGTQAQSAKIMLYGDFSKYVIRMIRGITLRRDDSRYFDELNVGFVGFMRLDGNLVDAQAIKFLQNKTS